MTGEKSSSAGSLMGPEWAVNLLKPAAPSALRLIKNDRGRLFAPVVPNKKRGWNCFQPRSRFYRSV
jgi:hypothetical protein